MAQRFWAALRISCRVVAPNVAENIYVEYSNFSRYFAMKVNLTSHLFFFTIELIHAVTTCPLRRLLCSLSRGYENRLVTALMGYLKESRSCVFRLIKLFVFTILVPTRERDNRRDKTNVWNIPSNKSHMWGSVLVCFREKESKIPSTYYKFINCTYFSRIVSKLTVILNWLLLKSLTLRI